MIELNLDNQTEQTVLKPNVAFSVRTKHVEKITCICFTFKAYM